MGNRYEVQIAIDLAAAAGLSQRYMYNTHNYSSPVATMITTAYSTYLLVAMIITDYITMHARQRLINGLGPTLFYFDAGYQHYRNSRRR